jgi:hypothetical protein
MPGAVAGAARAGSAHRGAASSGRARAASGPSIWPLEQNLLPLVRPLGHGGPWPAQAARRDPPAASQPLPHAAQLPSFEQRQPITTEYKLSLVALAAEQAACLSWEQLCSVLRAVKQAQATGSDEQPSRAAVTRLVRELRTRRYLSARFGLPEGALSAGEARMGLPSRLPSSGGVRPLATAARRHAEAGQGSGEELAAACSMEVRQHAGVNVAAAAGPRVEAAQPAVVGSPAEHSDRPVASTRRCKTRSPRLPPGMALAAAAACVPGREPVTHLLRRLNASAASLPPRLAVEALQVRPAGVAAPLPASQWAASTCRPCAKARTVPHDSHVFP